MLMIDLNIADEEPLIIILPDGEKLELRLKRVRGKRRACIGVHGTTKARILGPHIVKREKIEYESKLEIEGNGTKFY